MSSEKEVRVLYTTDYGMFVPMKGNRQEEIRMKKVDMMVKYIEEGKNFLHLKPIIVDKIFHVADGLHRLSAAEKAGVPIYYIVEPEITMDDVKMLNYLQSGWTKKDSVASEVGNGNPDYVYLTKFCEQYGITRANAELLLSGKERETHIGEKSSAYKTALGKFKVLDKDGAEKAAQFLTFIKPRISRGVWGDREFVRAVMDLVKQPTDVYESVVKGVEATFKDPRTDKILPGFQYKMVSRPYYKEQIASFLEKFVPDRYKKGLYFQKPW